MSVLNIITHPNPLLHQVCSDITVFDDRIEKLVEDMFETMTYYSGVGLAGPQIGLLENIFVAQYNNRSIALINPKITHMEGSSWAEEGCLSIPGVLLEVERAKKITVHATNKNGKSIVLNEKGFFARIIQHEIDHLNGILILDKPEKPK